jgi:hypothetical protein
MGQSANIAWSSNFGGSSHDYINSIIQTSDGGLISIGYTYSLDHDAIGHYGASDVFVVKTDNIGVLQWSKSYGGSLADTGLDILQTSDGGYILLAQTSSNDGNVIGTHIGGLDIWLVKINSTGSIVWQKCFGGSGSDAGLSIINTSDGGFLTVGSSNSNDGDIVNFHASDDFLIMKFDSLGNLSWSRCYGGSSMDNARDVLQSIDNNYLVCGYINSIDGDISSNNGGGDIWVLKIDISGNILDSRNFGGIGYERGDRIVEFADGSFAIAGSTGSASITGFHGFNDAWIFKANFNSGILWSNCIGGTGNDAFYGMTKLPDGTCILVGTSNSNNGDITSNHSGSDDIFVAKIDSFGLNEWVVNIGGSNYDFGTDIIYDINGNIVFSGFSNSFDFDFQSNWGGRDAWLVKMSSSTNNISSFESQNNFVYPNPAQDKLHIEFSKQLNSEATLEMYDLTGKKVYEMQLEANNQKTEITNLNLSNGIYFYRISNGEQNLQQGKLSISK